MNEVIFLFTAVIDLTLVLLAMRFGKSGLVATIVANVILVSTFGAKIISVFSFETNAANVFYACIFLAINILTEHYGKKEGQNAIWIGFLGLILFIIMGQFTIYYADPQSSGIDLAIQTLFTAVPRIAFASMFAYLVATNLDVQLFDLLHSKSRKKNLWLRNLGSQTIAQVIDSLLFFSIAFYGILPMPLLIESIVTGYGLKMIVAAVSTPFIYVSYLIKPIDR